MDTPSPPVDPGLLDVADDDEGEPKHGENNEHTSNIPEDPAPLPPPQAETDDKMHGTTGEEDGRKIDTNAKVVLESTQPAAPPVTGTATVSQEEDVTDPTQLADLAATSTTAPAQAVSASPGKTEATDTRGPDTTAVTSESTASHMATPESTTVTTSMSVTTAEPEREPVTVPTPAAAMTVHAPAVAVTAHMPAAAVTVPATAEPVTVPASEEAVTVAAPAEAVTVPVIVPAHAAAVTAASTVPATAAAAASTSPHDELVTAHGTLSVAVHLHSSATAPHKDAQPLHLPNAVTSIAPAPVASGAMAVTVTTDKLCAICLEMDSSEPFCHFTPATKGFCEKGRGQESELWEEVLVHVKCGMMAEYKGKPLYEIQSVKGSYQQHRHRPYYHAAIARVRKARASNEDDPNEYCLVRELKETLQRVEDANSEGVARAGVILQVSPAGGGEDTKGHQSKSMPPVAHAPLIGRQLVATAIEPASPSSAITPEAATVTDNNSFAAASAMETIPSNVPPGACIICCKNSEDDPKAPMCTFAPSREGENGFTRNLAGVTIHTQCGMMARYKPVWKPHWELMSVKAAYSKYRNQPGYHYAIKHTRQAEAHAGGEPSGWLYCFVKELTDNMKEIEGQMDANSAISATKRKRGRPRKSDAEKLEAANARRKKGRLLNVQPFYQQHQHLPSQQHQQAQLPAQPQPQPQPFTHPQSMYPAPGTNPQLTPQAPVGANAPIKRKRGRPRKYPLDPNVPLSPNKGPACARNDGQPEFLATSPPIPQVPVPAASAIAAANGPGSALYPLGRDMKEELLRARELHRSAGAIEAMQNDPSNTKHLKDHPAASSKLKEVIQSMRGESMLILNTPDSALSSFEVGLKALMKFDREHGHCLVPTTHEDQALSRWVSRQRTRAREREAYKSPAARARIDEEIATLDRVGFVWKVYKS